MSGELYFLDVLCKMFTNNWYSMYYIKKCLRRK